ncbi:MAG: hypothetical protein CL458_05210 [Acidimicrobiaceae bacterium]|nr:hypothetical protein [Acidimicrobiaceae bacterium]|tara:strand:+ start:87732 stop:88319 length:588 start_codon:yes stop_codon:yes gene_type:complete
MNDSTPDRELLRLHRRACTDFAARMRLPAWEHLPMPLIPPMSDLTVGDLLCRVANGNLATAAELAGQAVPAPVELGIEPTEVVVESIRTVLTVASALDHQSGFSPQRRELLWQRVVEITMLGYDLQQAIRAGTGLDDLLVDRISAVEPDVTVWPFLDSLDFDMSTPPILRLLAQHGRPAGLWVDPSDPSCGTGQC